MLTDDDDIRRWTVEDHENARFEDDHVEPYVYLRRISADPAVRQVTFPPNATLGAHSHPCDTLYVIQSGEFIVDGEDTYRPGDLRWVKAGRHVRAGARRRRGRRRAHRVDQRRLRRALGSATRLMALVAAQLAAERPDEVALRDDDVALGWAQVNDVLNRVVNGLGELRPRPRPPGRGVRREQRGDGARPPRRPARRHLDRAGQLPPQRRRGGLHPRRTRAPGCCSSVRARPPSGSTRHDRPACRSSSAGGSTAQPDVRSWEDWLAAASPAEPSPDVEPRPNLMYTSGTTGRPKGVELPPTMFAGGGTMTEHVAALGAERVRRLRHPPRRRPDVPHRPAVGRAAARRRHPRRRARPLRRRERAAGDRDPPGRDDRDGADPLRPPAGAARGRAGAATTSARCGSSPTPAPPARST